MGDGEVCLYSNPQKQNFELFEKKGLNLEKCCKCNGNGDGSGCPNGDYVPKELKLMKLHEQRYLFYHFNVFDFVKS